MHITSTALFLTFCKKTLRKVPMMNGKHLQPKSLVLVVARSLVPRFARNQRDIDFSYSPQIQLPIKGTLPEKIPVQTKPPLVWSDSVRSWVIDPERTQPEGDTPLGWALCKSRISRKKRTVTLLLSAIIPAMVISRLRGGGLFSIFYLIYPYSGWSTLTHFWVCACCILSLTLTGNCVYINWVNTGQNQRLLPGECVARWRRRDDVMRERFQCQVLCAVERGSFDSFAEGDLIFLNFVLKIFIIDPRVPDT